MLTIFRNSKCERNNGWVRITSWITLVLYSAVVGGTENSPVAVEGVQEKSVPDGVIESVSMGIKYELTRLKQVQKD